MQFIPTRLFRHILQWGTPRNLKTDIRKLALWLIIVFALQCLSTGHADTPYDELDASAVVSGPTFNVAKGVWSYSVTSQFQANANVIEVLLPASYTPSKSYQVLYVLPVEAGTGVTYGDGLQVVKTAGLQDTYDIICVQPTFIQPPWFGDHATDPTKRYESYMNRVVVPLIENRYSTIKELKGRLLLGFSKSGWGAFALLMRNPAIYGFAASWDAPMLMDFGVYNTSTVFADAQNFQQFSPKILAQSPPPSLHTQRRLILLGENLFGTEPNGLFTAAPHTKTYHSQLSDAGILHYFDANMPSAHLWDIVWVRPSVETLMALSRLDGGIGATLFSANFEDATTTASLENSVSPGHWILSSPRSSTLSANGDLSNHALLMTGSSGKPYSFRAVLGAPFALSREGTLKFDVSVKEGYGTETSGYGHDRDNFVFGLDENGNELFRLLIAGWTTEGRIGYVDAGGAEHFLGGPTNNIKRNSSTTYDPASMRTVCVDLLPTGITISLQGLPLATSVPYTSSGTRLCEIAFRGESTYSSIYYDNIFLTVQTPFQKWQERNWPSIDNTSIIGINANPSGDGLSNLLKYATGRDPREALSQPLISFQLDGSGQPLLTFPRWTGATDVTYSVEASSDLSRWETIWTGKNDFFEGDGSTVTQGVTEPLANFPNGRRFMRLKVSQP